jgi:hypothetical protein
VSHPEAHRLSAYARGQLALADADEVERHLAECPECCERAARAGKDGFIACLQSAAGVETHSAHANATPTDWAPGLEGLPGPLREHPRYRVLRLLGRGGMGEVYLAEHLVMKRQVALKVIRPDLVSSPELVARFQREVQAAARLTHPNIVAAYDAEQAGGVHFLIMEFVEGASLAALLRAQGPLAVAEACDYARQAALGLEHARKCGLVHRDVKPENLLRNVAGEVKIADFGLARLLRGEEVASTTTSAGILVGTVDYIAPEQANDPTKSDIRADVYSLGCALYHLLAGQAPYPGGGVLDKLTRHLTGRPMRLGQLRPDVPLEVSRIVERMMAPDPARRFATPAEAAAALEPWCKPQPARKKPRRWPLVAAGMLMLVALMAGAAVYTFRTSKGTIEVRTTDPNVTVIARRNGEEIVIFDEKTKRKVTVLPAGDYDLELIDGSKKLELSVPQVKLKRGETVIVEVTRIPERPAKKDDRKKDERKEKVEEPKKDKTEEKDKPVKEAWPDDVAEVMKGKPDVDDDFSDQKKSAFDPLRIDGKELKEARYAIEAKYGKKLEVRFGENEMATRWVWLPNDVGACGDFVCKLEGQVPGEGLTWWGVMLVGRGGKGEDFEVLVSNTGMFVVEPRPGHPGVRCPVVKRTRHDAIRKGDQKNELAVAVVGGKLRIFINEVEVTPALDVPPDYASTIQSLYVRRQSRDPGTVTFHRFRRWKWPEPKKQTKPLTPAELEKLKPVFNDDFSDPKASAFVLPDKQTMKAAERAGMGVDFVKGQGYVVDMKPLEGKQPRTFFAMHQEGKSERFACRLVGRVKSEGKAAWAMILQGEPSLVFLVRVWNTGEIDTARFDESKRLDFDYPRLEKTAHKAIRKGDEKNELVVLAQGGKMRIFVNGESVCEPLAVPREFAEMDHGLFAEKPDRRQAARFTFSRCTLWKLPKR